MSIRDVLWEEIMVRCKKRGKMKTTPLRFIGHSLGGALACLSAIDFHFNADQRSFNDYKPSICDSVIQIKARTFGCPHVGNQEFANMFNIEVRDSFRFGLTITNSNFLNDYLSN
jgi:predicted lipase